MCHTHYLNDIHEVLISTEPSDPYILVVLNPDDCHYKLSLEKLGAMLHTSSSDAGKNWEISELRNTYVRADRDNDEAYKKCHGGENYEGNHTHEWDDLDHLEINTSLYGGGEIEFSVTFCNCHVSIPTLFLLEAVHHANKKKGNIRLDSEMLRFISNDLEDRIASLYDYAANMPLEGASPNYKYYIKVQDEQA